MEATGYYHVALADFLLGHEVSVSVVNPLSVKRFMHLSPTSTLSRKHCERKTLKRLKTDKSNARMIRKYAMVENVPVYQGKSSESAELLQSCRLMDVYLKQKTMFKIKLHGEKVLGYPSKAVRDSLEASLAFVKGQINALEEEMDCLVRSMYPGMHTHLCSIPGIGNRKATYLLAITDGFEKFETASQLVSYAGITTVQRESGTSVRGKSYMSNLSPTISAKPRERMTQIRSLETCCSCVRLTPANTTNHAVDYLNE